MQDGRRLAAVAAMFVSNTARTSSTDATGARPDFAT
jgi:hypothetical protein